MADKIAVIAAHPDDEILGCAGTMASHVQRGDGVHVLILAEGITSRGQERNQNACAADILDLALAAEKANKIIGVTSLTTKGFPDNRLDSLDRLEIIKVIEDFFREHRPNIVYTHHNGDVNIDHRRVHEAVITACRPVPGNLIHTLLFFETPSSTEWQPLLSAPAFVPNWFVDITLTLKLKLEALRAYSSELRLWPHPRSLEAIEHLACWRGSTIGVQAAEAFLLGRKIVCN